MGGFQGKEFSNSNGRPESDTIIFMKWLAQFLELLELYVV